MNSESPVSFPDRRPKLLIVDDDRNFCWVLQRAFEQRGYAVRTAQSVAQAREVLREWPPGFAVVDLCMPDASGLTVIPDIKAANPAVRVVVLTGDPRIETAIEAIKLGARNYLAKPADASAIEFAFGPRNGDALVSPAEQHPAPS